MIFEKNNQTLLWQSLVVIFLSAIFVMQPEASLQDDLDSAVRWASNHLFALGSEQLYLYPHTNGPLFFLKFPIPGNNSLLLAVIFDFSTKVILGLYLIRLSKLYRPSNLWLPVLLFVGLCAFVSLDFIIISIALVTSLIALKEQNLLPCLAGIIIIVLSIFIKASISFPALFIFGSTILLLMFNKHFAFSLKLSGVAITLFVVVAFILYGSLFDSLKWIFTAFVSTLSYGNDQAIYFNNFLPYIILTITSIAVIPFLIHNKQTKEFIFITVLAIFSIWKYSLGRQDFTHYRAWYMLCIVLACFIIIINHQKQAIIGFACCFFSLSFFVTNTIRGDSPKIYSFNMPQLDYFPRMILKSEKINNEVRNSSLNALANSVISDSMLQLIGNRSVDVFPWGLAVLYKYNLNYKPRPNFHSTILGAKTDTKEGIYFASKQAPDFLLWHDSQPLLYSLNAHDQVYLPNATPSAISAINTNYELRRYENGYALWEKVKSNGFAMHKGTSEKNIKFNKWFEAPTSDMKRAIYGRTNFKLSRFDKIRSFVYKGRFFKIIYLLKNGKEAAHFISMESLQNNFLLQPYFSNPSMQYEEVEKIKILPMSEKFTAQELALSYRNSFWVQ